MLSDARFNTINSNLNILTINLCFIDLNGGIQREIIQLSGAVEDFMVSSQNNGQLIRVNSKVR